jgi:outer membrane lipoprotein-sorting protein
MKSKFAFYLAFVLCAGWPRLAGAGQGADVPATGPSISTKAEQIFQQMADYYQNLKSFEGTNTIIDESPSLRYGGKMTRQRQFVFIRPNKFIVTSESTNDSRLFCDGTKFWEYQPYYFNSYTVAPAPARFEDAITNWLGGELVYVMVNTNRYHYLMSGCNWGMVSLRYAGEEPMNGITCHHLLMEKTASRTAEWWVAKGQSPFIVKYVLRCPSQDPTDGVWVHTETISGWQANQKIPGKRFTFVPPADAIYHPPGADDIEISSGGSNGPVRVKFYSRDDLLRRTSRLKNIATQGVLTNNPTLTTNDFVFTGFLNNMDIDNIETVIAWFELPKTAEKRIINGSTQTRVQAIKVIMSPDGLIQWITNGVSISFDSPAKPKQKLP